MGLYDLRRDWSMPLLTDLTVWGSDTCPQGWRPAYERIWHGMDIACDCLGVYDRWIRTDN